MIVHFICFICLFFRTILYVSVVYCGGNLIVFMTSLPPLGSGEVAGPMVGLFLIALSTGGIKPCVSAFGGDQFASDQSHLLQRFFSVFYFAINAGSLLSILITPVFRGGYTKQVVVICSWSVQLSFKRRNNNVVFYIKLGLSLFCHKWQCVCDIGRNLYSGNGYGARNVKYYSNVFLHVFVLFNKSHSNCSCYLLLLLYITHLTLQICDLYITNLTLEHESRFINFNKSGMRFVNCTKLLLRFINCKSCSFVICK